MNATVLSALRVGGTNILAAAALVLAAAGVQLWIPITLSLVALTLIVAFLGRRLTRKGLGTLGAFGASRLLIAASVATILARSDSEAPHTAVGCALLVLLLIGSESAFSRIWRSAARPVANLPGFAIKRPYTVHGGKLVLLGISLLGILLGAPFFGPWYGLVALALTLLAIGVVASWFFSAIHDRIRVSEEVPKAVSEYAPEFMIYISGPRGTEYQIKMWLPYLEDLGEKFVVVARESALVSPLAQLTHSPIVSARTLAELDQIQNDSMRTSFYVNNGTKNTHNVRYRHMTHVQLLHGESDKPSSYNAVTAMFDKIFVAGQAGIDRYSDHGVNIPVDRFEIVGRPQVSDILRAVEPQKSDVALYAPTWTGFHSDNNFGSLSVGLRIVESLISKGWTVMFRPHPYSLRDPISLEQISEIEAALHQDCLINGTKHVFGAEASNTLSLTECFNASDALVSDISSVPADYLFSEKPFVITKMSTVDTDEYLAEFRLAHAGYVADIHDPEGINTAISRLRSDGKAASRRETRIYYLGDIPVESYGERFTDTARRIVSSGTESNISVGDSLSANNDMEVESDTQETLGDQSVD